MDDQTNYAKENMAYKPGADYDGPTTESILRDPRGEHGSQLPLSMQEKAIYQLAEAIEELQGRLSPILTPDNSTVETKAPGLVGSEKERPEASPLAEQLYVNNKAISKSSGRIRYIMGRLEC